MAEKHYIIPVFVPHKGCPHDCIFCNQKKISGQTVEMTSVKMRQIIEAHLNTIKHGNDIEIGFYGGSFTGMEKAKQIEFLAVANEYVRDGRISKIRLSTRPDYIDPSVLEYLKSYNVGTIELGVQSLDDEVLKASCRGHTSEAVFAASGLIRKYGFSLGIQTMTGLPRDNREKAVNTAKKVISLAPALVRIYPVLVIRGTYLEALLRQGLYNPPTLDETVDLCSELLELYRKSNINVIRIGLQPTEDISKGAEVAAGPFHPAFRQLVESRLAFKRMEEKIKALGEDMPPRILITTGPGNISNITGQKRKNIIDLKAKFKLEKITVISDPALGREIFISFSPDLL